MNLAFQALAIFALALPGIILKNAYANGLFWDRPRQTSPLAEEVAYSLILACALHGAYAPFVDRFFGSIDLGAVSILLLGQYGRNNELLEPAIGALTSHPGRMLAYFASLYALAALLGYGAHWVVRALRLDRRHKAFRFDNRWHYLLKGEIATFADSQISVENFDFILVAAVVDAAAGSLLYVGILDTFFFNPSGDLDLLVLTGAMRRPLKADEGDDGQKPPYFFIDAEYLYLKYTEIRNVSIRYITIPAD